MNNLITVLEMANMLKISRSKAYSLIKEKDFPLVKIGKCIRIKKDELLKWLHIWKNRAKMQICKLESRKEEFWEDI